MPNYYELQGTNPERSLAAFGQVGYAITPDLKLERGRTLYRQPVARTMS